MWAILSLAGPDTETSTALHAALGCVGKQHVPVDTNRTVSTALWIRQLKYSYTPLVNSTSFPTELGKKKGAECQIILCSPAPDAGSTPSHPQRTADGLCLPDPHANWRASLARSTLQGVHTKPPLISRDLICWGSSHGTTVPQPSPEPCQLVGSRHMDACCQQVLLTWSFCSEQWPRCSRCSLLAWLKSKALHQGSGDTGGSSYSTMQLEKKRNQENDWDKPRDSILLQKHIFFLTGVNILALQSQRVWPLLPSLWLLDWEQCLCLVEFYFVNNIFLFFQAAASLLLGDICHLFYNFTIIWW